MKRIIKLTESDLTRIVKRILNEDNTWDVPSFHLFDGKPNKPELQKNKVIPTSSEILKHLRGKRSAFFKFENQDDGFWVNVLDYPIRNSVDRAMLDFVIPTDSYDSYDKFKESKWYNLTKFPFSNVKNFENSDGEKIFNKYLSKYGNFIVIDLTT